MKHKIFFTSFFISIFMLPLNIYSDTPDTWWNILLRISGISATPSSQKSSNETLSGEVWIVNILDGSSLRRVTQKKIYNSPIYHVGMGSIFALAEGYIVIIKKNFGLEHSTRLFPANDVIKLVGVDNSDPDKILILNKDNTVGLLSIKTGSIETLVHEPTEKNKGMINYIQGETRKYNDNIIYLKKDTKSTFGGKIEWTNIYLKKEEENPVNISKCDEKICSQPTMSSDEKYIVFIKSKIQ